MNNVLMLPERTRMNIPANGGVFFTPRAMENWYCIFVQSGYEEKIRTFKLNKYCPHLTFMIPKKQIRQRQEGLWGEILRPIFPGYILVKGYLNYTDCYQIRRLQHVVRVLTDHSGEPSKINPEEIELLLKLLQNGEIIRPSRGIDRGDRVEIIEGPLKSLKGLVYSINRRKERARILFDFMNQQRKIDVGLKIIRLMEEENK